MAKAEIDALEDCLERLQAGAGIDQILALYPQWAEYLRPLLESAQMARSLRVTSSVHQGAMAHSRKLFIEKTLNPHRQGVFGLNLHLSRSFLASISAILILAIATSFVSAQSIPGDILYPVKIAGEQTRLLLTSNSTQRLELEESFDDTRADEVEDVLQAHRLVKVTFVGLLTRNVKDQWQVGVVTVIFPPELKSIYGQMINTYVEVTGIAQSDDLVLVSLIHLRELDFSGTLIHIGVDSWLVDQLVVRVGSGTVIHGVPSVGAYVSIKAYRLEDGTLEAGQIDLINQGKQEVQVTPSQQPRVETVTLSTRVESGGGSTDQRNTSTAESDGIPQQASNTPAQGSYLASTSTQEVQATATHQEEVQTSTTTPPLSNDTPTTTMTSTSVQPTETQKVDTATPTQGEHSDNHQPPTPTPTPPNHGEGG